MTRAQHDARAERKRRECEEAGIPIREDWRPQPIALDLSDVGGHSLTIEKGRGTKWRARRLDTGEVVAHGSLKQVLHALADTLPRAASERNWH